MCSCDCSRKSSTSDSSDESVRVLNGLQDSSFIHSSDAKYRSPAIEDIVAKAKNMKVDNTDILRQLEESLELRQSWTTEEFVHKLMKLVSGSPNVLKMESPSESRLV